MDIELGGKPKWLPLNIAHNDFWKGTLKMNFTEKKREKDQI